MIVLGSFGQMDVDGPPREMAESWEHFRLVDDVKPGRLGKTNHIRFGNNGATCPIFVAGASRPQFTSSASNPRLFATPS